MKRQCPPLVHLPVVGMSVAVDSLGEGSLGLGYSNCHHFVGHRMKIGLAGDLASNLVGDHRNTTWRMMILLCNAIRDLRERPVRIEEI